MTTRPRQPQRGDLPAKFIAARPGVVLVEGHVNERDMARSCQRRIEERKNKSPKPGDIAARIRADLARRK